MEHDRRVGSNDNLTRGQRAIRDAAKRLAEGADTRSVPPPNDGGMPELPPLTTAREDPATDTTPCRLLDVDELFVGRPSLGAVFAYRDATGEVLADVKVLHTPEHTKLDALLAGESTRHVDERWVVVHDGEALFFVEQYRATGHSSYGVFGPDGDSLGTYVSEGGLLHHNVVVREAATAPVATIQVRHHRHVITHANGDEIGYCWRAFVTIGNDEDDEVWGLQLETDADLLDRRALVAAPLVCHLMAFPKRHFDSGGEIGVLLIETVPPVGLAVVGIERTLDGLYWLRRRLE